MRLGFATDEDQDSAPDGVVDGRADEREPSPHEVAELFLSMCVKLRAMGCLRLEAFGMTARFPAEAVQPVATPVVVAPPPVAAEKRERKRKPEKGPADDVFPDQEGDTEEDRVRRRKYRDLASVIVGK